MPNVSLKTKKTYFTKVKKANYAASLRLEGMESTIPARSMISKAAVLEKYRQN